MAARRCAAPFPGPAAPGHGGARSAVELTPERQAEGPLSPAPWRRAGWAPAASGAGGVRQGAVPLGIGSQQDVQHGCFRGRSGCSFCCFLFGFCGLPAERPADLSCRLGDGSRSVPVRPLVAVDGGRDDGGKTAFLVDCQRAHRGQHGALVPHPPQYVADDGERLGL